MPDPTPTELVRELRDAVGLFSGAMPISPRQAWDEAIAVAKRAVHERDAYEAARPVAGPAGQPCPHIVTTDEGTSHCTLAEGTRP
jgi:hypothetical protein